MKNYYSFKYILIVFLFLWTPAVSFAQNPPIGKAYARSIVDTLASPYMGGRGYIDNGNKRAADYIDAQYKTIGLLPFDGSYEQRFSYPVNTYPTAYIVSVNGVVAEPGADYIIMPWTPTMKGNYPVVKFDRAIYTDSNKMKAFFSRDYSQTFILVDDSGSSDDKKEKQFWEYMRFNPFKAKGVIILCDKLTEETSQTVANYATLDALRKSSFRYAQSISIDVRNKLIKSFPTQNIIGYIKGNMQPDSFIVFTAHYDHLGKMGSIYFPGANDNASGVAMLLNLARYYSQHTDSLRYSIAFMAFSGEEIDLLGSKYYTEHPLFPLSNIRFLINMDIMGTGDDGITVVNGTIYKPAFDDLVDINNTYHLLSLIKPRGETANSDHYFFYQNHVPSIFIYTMGGIKAYHDIYDRRETLPLTDFDQALKLLIQFTSDINQRKF